MVWVLNCRRIHATVCFPTCSNTVAWFECLQRLLNRWCVYTSFWCVIISIDCDIKLHHDVYIYILQYRMHAVRPVVQIELASGFSQTWPYCSSAGVSFWFLLPLSNTAGSSCWKGHQSYATVQPRHGSSGQGTPLSPGVSVCEGGRASTSNL